MVRYHSSIIDKSHPRWYNACMKALYFDTETTGLRPDGFLQAGTVHMGKICQLAYVMEEDGGLTAKNFYFAVDAIEASASAVTGLTVPIVMRLSRGEVFADHADEIWQDFATADVLVAHNLAFDERFMRAEFGRLGMSFEVGYKGFCTMQRFAPVLKLPGKGSRYKMPSLEEFAVCEGVSMPEIMDMMDALYHTRKAAHDARHDVVKMWLAMDHACRGDLTLAAAFGKF